MLPTLNPIFVFYRWSVRPGIGKSYTVPIFRLMIEQYAREGVSCYSNIHDILLSIFYSHVMANYNNVINHAVYMDVIP